VDEMQRKLEKARARANPSVTIIKTANKKGRPACAEIKPEHFFFMLLYLFYFNYFLVVLSFKF
jgi:hypothetical protein